MELRKAFGVAFSKIRKSKDLTQEDFEPVSPRTYISHIERGLSSPTMEKLHALSDVMGIHPVSLVFQTYLTYDRKISALDLIGTIMDDLKKIEKYERFIE